MLEVQKRHRVAYPIDKVFRVVVDVNNYKTFIPWCLESKVLVPTEPQKDTFQADLTVGVGPLKETYRSTVTCYPHEKINVICQEKPLKFLETNWDFLEIDKNLTEITFNIQFSLNSILLQSLIKKVFEKSSEKILYAFENRLHTLYSETDFS